MDQIVFIVLVQCFVVSVRAACRNSSEYFSIQPFLDVYAPLRTRNRLCYAEALYFRNAALQRTPWAIQMLDASSKIPSSLMTGNTVDLGSFDECLAVRSDNVINNEQVQGQHCLIAAQFNESNELSMGSMIKKWTFSACVPAACTPEDIWSQLTYALNNKTTQLKVINCERSIESTFSTSSWLMLIFLLIFTIFVLTATWIEYRSIRIPNQTAKAVILAFSLIQNGNVFATTVPPGLMVDSIHGIRVLSVLSITTFHVFLSESRMPYMNHAQVTKQMSDNVFGILVLNGPLALDVLFMLSGLVFAYNHMRETKAQYPFSYVKHAVHRYLRITPAYLMTIILHATIFTEIGSGPLWNKYAASIGVNCVRYWWTNILYINNYIYSNPQKQCMAHTWYFGAEMQYYLIAPLFLFVLIKNRTHGIALITVIGAASCIFTFCITLWKDYPWTLVINSNDSRKLDDYYMDVHEGAHTRITPYLIGLLLGYFLEHYKKDKLGLCMLSRIIGWSIWSVIIVTVVFGLFFWYAYGCGSFISALYASLHRPLFVTAIGWIIFVCEQGYGGMINKILSCRAFQFFSKLSFCLYLVHYLPIRYNLGSQRTVGYFSYYLAFQKLVSHIFISLIISVVLSLTLEHPIIQLNKLIFKKGK